MKKLSHTLNFSWLNHFLCCLVIVSMQIKRFRHLYYKIRNWISSGKFVNSLLKLVKVETFYKFLMHLTVSMKCSVKIFMMKNWKNKMWFSKWKWVKAIYKVCINPQKKKSNILNMNWVQLKMLWKMLNHLSNTKKLNFKNEQIKTN